MIYEIGRASILPRWALILSNVLTFFDQRVDGERERGGVGVGGDGGARGLRRVIIQSGRRERGDYASS